MTSGSPDYVVDTMLFFYLDQAVTWADELHMRLILDNHTIEGANSDTVEKPLMKIWPQMAQHYKDQSDVLIYEILNEPNNFSASKWAVIQQQVLDTIRTIDSVHTVIVTGADWGGIYGLTNLTPLSDTNLIYSFHFYDPFLFTHQGATWPTPSLGDLGNVPFPYDAARMPACPASLKGTWVENSLKYNYKTDGTVAKLESTLDQAIAYGKTHNVKIYCGELGVYFAKSPEADRVEWYRAVSSYLTEKQVPWTMWDYQGGFGLFNKGSNETFEYDLNRPMGEAMGLTLPPYEEYILTPDTTGFIIYDDFMGEGLQYGGVPGGGIADLFSEDAHDGLFSVYLTGSPQYGALDFDFRFTKDMSLLRRSNTVLSLWVKATAKDASVVFRFLDTKTTDPTDHPWRMDYTLRSTAAAPFDSTWHQVVIPLKSFQDIGSWDNGWFNSQNKFDWKAVDKFQIVAEHAALTGKEFWFDNIELVKGELEPSFVNEIGLPVPAFLYPNPVSEQLNINIALPEAGFFSVAIFDLTGREISRVYENNHAAGTERITWDLTNHAGRKVANGIYLCKVTSGSNTFVMRFSVAD
jgi:endoglucanase